MRTEDLFQFISERYAVLQRRKQGLPKPWTQDPILQNYRFCNVYRENDTVTQWIKAHWRDTFTNDKDVWFAMAVARFVNWPDTLAEIGYPIPWDAKRFVRIMADRKARGEKVFTGAYVIHAGHGSKAEHVAYDILEPLWHWRDSVLEATTSCARLQNRLEEFHGVGSFMAGQIVCDTKYTRLLDTAGDWWEFAVEGPGSRRGLNRVMGRPVNQRWKTDEWFVILSGLRAAILPMIHAAGMPPMHAQDLQNCLCEFDKFERVRLEEGRPRNNYPGHADVSTTLTTWGNVSNSTEGA
jgi:alpha-glutamyl/putrescinyl thymine pyrophosphorylase clade 1